MTKMIRELQGTVPAASQLSKDDHYAKHGFLEQMQFDAQTQMEQCLDMKMARALCIRGDLETERRLRSILKAHLKQAFETTCMKT